jgi:ribosomal protein S18 acetylase RimI-like enzyme
VDIRTATPADLEDVFELLSIQSRAAFGVSEVARDHVAHSLSADWMDHFLTVGGYANLNGAQEVIVASRDEETNDALLAAVFERARERGFDRLRAVVASGDEPFGALVQRAGFEHEGDVLRMWRRVDGEVPEPAWPEGVSVRTYTDDDSVAIHALLDEAYSAWDETYGPRTHDDWLQWMTAHEEFDPTLWLIVERDGELVACSLSWATHQGRGWLKDIAVRESERGRGLAKALLNATFRAYAKRDADRVGLKVETTNPTGAPQLYERIGFVTDQRYGVWVKVL